MSEILLLVFPEEQPDFTGTHPHPLPGWAPPLTTLHFPHGAAGPTADQPSSH